MSSFHRTSDVLIIVPAFNEELNIVQTVDTIRQFNVHYDVIVVNDGSSDRTAEQCRIHDIPVIDLVSNLGIGGAVQTGYKYALYHGYAVAVQFDGDGQHNVEFIPSLIAPIEKGECSFTIGSRFLEENDGFKSTWSRRFGIRFISFLLERTIHLKITDPTSGFRAANQDVMELFVKHYPTEYPEPSSLVVLHKYHQTIKELPVLMNTRVKGFSTITNWKSLYYMINVSLLIILLSLTQFQDTQKPL